MGARRFRALLRGMPPDAAWIRAVAEAAFEERPPPGGGGRVVRMGDWASRREPDAAKAEAILRRLGGEAVSRGE